jgi:acetoin:2,6-dichlorophenolindophenol oxidoreductase subunit alpha
MISKISQNKLLAMYKQMLLIRSFEEKIIELYPEQEIQTPVHLCIGQEAIAVGVCANLRANDYMFSTHRNHGHCISKGMSLKKLLAEFYGRSTGCAGGKGGSMHPVDPGVGILGTTAIVGGGIPLAVGTALASSMRNTDQVTVVFFGDGAAEEGTFHESLNYAALKKLPVVFVCENNKYATASPIGNRQPKGSSIAERAGSYGIDTDSVDGNDLFAVYDSMEKGLKLTRNGEGPYFIEVETYRWMPHVGVGDDTLTGHRPPEELSQWKKRCPIKAIKKRLLEYGWIDEQLIKVFRKDIDEQITEALDFAKTSSKPGTEELMTHVLKEG